MTTEQLNEFYILSTTLNYSKAADKLYLSQSVLSRHIKSMEKELKVSLFSRNTRNIELTSEGKFLQSQIPKLLRKEMDIESILNLEFINATGKVKIIFSSQTLTSRILQFLQDFQEHYKNINLEMEPLTAYSDIDLLYSADVIISPCDFTNTAPAEIESMLVMTQPAVLAIPPHHPFGGEPTVRLFDLRDETLIVPYADDLTGPYALLSYLAARKCYGHLSKIAATTPEQAFLFVELGRGVMIIPHHLKHHVYAHTRTVPISDSECCFPIYVYYNRSNNNGAASLFFKSMMEQFQITCAQET